MKLFYVLILLIQMINCENIFGEEVSQDPLAGIHVSRSEINQMLESMKISGKISNADYESAKKDLTSMGENKIAEMNSMAISLIRKNPDAATGLINKEKIDFKEVEKVLSE